MRATARRLANIDANPFISDGCAFSNGWVGIVANAGSGSGHGRVRVARLAKALEQRKIAVQVAWTPAERSSLVASSRRDGACRCLVAVGGDGTVAALINERPAVPISVLPAGTENLFARHFRLGRSPERLAATIDLGRHIAIDLGDTLHRRFALMAGIGFDAAVVNRHHTARLARDGVANPTNRIAYVESVLDQSMRYPFPRLTVTVEEAPSGKVEVLSGTSIFVFNLPRYALGLPFAPSARADDGLLDLLVFDKPGPFNALRYLWLVLRGLHMRRHGVHHRLIRRVAVTASDPTPAQLDGDPGGFVTADAESPMRIAVAPSALKVIV